MKLSRHYERDSNLFLLERLKRLVVAPSPESSETEILVTLSCENTRNDLSLLADRPEKSDKECDDEEDRSEERCIKSAEQHQNEVEHSMEDN